MTYRAQVVIALLSLAGGAIAGGPGESVQAASLDAAKLPAEIRQHCRYLSLYNLPAKDRAEFLKVLTFHCNSLSREADLVAPVAVGADVVRVNMLDYGWDRSVWEKLAAVDPYFHVRLADGQLVVPTVRAVEVPVVAAIQIEGFQFYRDGPGQSIVEVQKADIKAGETVWVREVAGGSIRKVTAGQKQAEKPAKAVEAKQVNAQAPWLPATDIAALALAVNSEAPILRADWFVFWTGIQVNRKGAGYYDFLGFKTRDDLQKAVALDIEAAKRVRKEMAAIVSESGVALNNRQVLRFQTLTGGYWATLDANANEEARNAIRVLNGDFKHDAEEIYGVLPNGLFAFGASNADGTLQETVPDTIAGDHVSTSNDRRIHPGLSCIRCHVEGLRPIDDWARKIYRGPVQIASPDYQKLKRLQRLYLSDLPGQLKLDQEAYQRALKQCNGLAPEANARAYGGVWSAYLDRSLGIEETARELGCTPAAWRTALVEYGKRGNADPVLLGLLANPPAKIRREHFHEVYATAHVVLKGVKP